MGEQVPGTGGERRARGVPPAPGGEAPGNRQASLSAYVNERGEICVGEECFVLGYDPKRDEVRVVLDEENCPQELLAAFERLSKGVTKGAPTVYERRRKQKRGGNE